MFISHLGGLFVFWAVRVHERLIGVVNIEPNELRGFD